VSEPLHPRKENFPGGDFTFISRTSGTTRTFLPGEIIDNVYQLTALLGRGGMGIVYACHHKALDKDYAIKLLNGEDLNGEYWTRFQIEAQALAKLNHPAIVGIYNMGKADGQYPYYVMDLLSGEALDSLIQAKGRLPVQQALDFFIPIADALSFAHAQGSIHRDIKPSNIMLVRDSQNNITAVKLVDFGIARLSKHSLTTQSQTATGLVFGTPFYMSPEQCQGERVDERSDIYSLGCALFETLTGAPPFVGENSFHTFMMHQNTMPPRLAQVAPDSDFSQSLEFAIAKMLAKNVADRYQTMAQVKHDLERIKAGKLVMVKGQSTTIAPTGISPLVPTAVPDKKAPAHNTILIASTAILLILATASVTTLVIHSLNQKPLVVLNAKHEKDENEALSYQGSLFPAVENEKREDKNLTKSGENLHSSENHSALDETTSLFAAPTAALKEAGATDAEIAKLRKFDLLSLGADEKNFHKRLGPYMQRFFSSGETLKTLEPTPVFRFPSNISLGVIQFDHQKPMQAFDRIAIPEGQTVSFFMRHVTKEDQRVVELFEPDDLNTLEIVTNQPEEIISKISSWKKLENLSFFNSLEKSLPKFKRWDQSDLKDENLPKLECLRKLKGLGVCSNNVTGAKVLKMPMLRRLNSLRVKNINDIEALLSGLPKFPNIQELWLVDQATTDKQLEPLTKMKKLRTLRIRRSHLTPASQTYFEQMPALKELWLDRPWTSAEKEKFKKAIPGCNFEPVLDETYWRCIPHIHPD